MTSSAVEKMAAKAPGPQRHTVLLVDDDPELLRALSVLLRREYRVLTAPNGEQALDLLGREDVQVILSDQRMPDMSGVELLTRARKVRPDAMRLLCTGFTDAHDAIAAINQGHVYRYITKPVDSEDLKVIVREAVERYDLIEERRRLLEELRGKNEELEAANAQLRAADALKTNFIRVASHELRTPLTILLGLSQLAAKWPEVPAGLHDKLSRMTAASQRMQHLIDQLVAMLAAGQFDSKVDRQPTDLSVLLKQAADDVRPFLELRNQTFRAMIPDNLGVHRVDAMKLRDSVNHLLLNAVKFTPDGGEIKLRAYRAGGDAVIEIEDTGVGMSAEHMEHLFEPFFTGHDVSRHQSGHFEFNRQGLGLGLSVVKAFIEQHGGSIGVESRPGEGSMFRITLPGG